MAPRVASAASVDTHLELLAWLHWLWAGFNAAIAVATGCFAIAAALAGAGGSGVPDEGLAADLTAGAFLLVSLAALVWSATHWWCAGALRRREPGGRLLALGLSVFDALLVPLGTLLAGYTAWLLLQDESRRRFGAA